MEPTESTVRWGAVSAVETLHNLWHKMLSACTLCKTLLFSQSHICISRANECNVKMGQPDGDWYGPSICQIVKPRHSRHSGRVEIMDQN